MTLDEAEQDLQLALYALACREVPELAELGELESLVYLYPRLVAHGQARRAAARRSRRISPTAHEARVLGMVAQIAAERVRLLARGRLPVVRVQANLPPPLRTGRAAVNPTDEQRADPRPRARARCGSRPAPAPARPTRSGGDRRS